MFLIWEGFTYSWQPVESLWVSLGLDPFDSLEPSTALKVQPEEQRGESRNDTAWHYISGFGGHFTGLAKSCLFLHMQLILNRFLKLVLIEFQCYIW